MNGALVHSKKVGVWGGGVLFRREQDCSIASGLEGYQLRPVVFQSCVSTVQNGDGYVDSEAKLKKIKDAVEAALKA